MWKKKSQRPITTQLKHNNKKHILLVFYKVRKKFNEIQLNLKKFKSKKTFKKCIKFSNLQIQFKKDIIESLEKSKKIKGEHE